MNLEELVAAVLDVEPTLVGPTTGRDDVENWDSLAQLGIVSAVEETYAVQFSSQEMKELASVPAIRAALGSKGVDA
jgi:acyl carrier protein